MTREELIAKKKEDIIDALNFSVIRILGDTDPDTIQERISELIEMLQKDSESLSHIDELLRLYAMFYEGE